VREHDDGGTALWWGRSRVRAVDRDAGVAAGRDGSSCRRARRTCTGRARSDRKRRRRRAVRPLAAIGRVRVDGPGVVPGRDMVVRGSIRDGRCRRVALVVARVVAGLPRRGRLATSPLPASVTALPPSTPKSRMRRTRLRRRRPRVTVRETSSVQPLIDLLLARRPSVRRRARSRRTPDHCGREALDLLAVRTRRRKANLGS